MGAAEYFHFVMADGCYGFDMLGGGSSERVSAHNRALMLLSRHDG